MARRRGPLARLKADLCAVYAWLIAHNACLCTVGLWRQCWWLNEWLWRWRMP
jgi:hypothetical protein